ncbi:FAD-dependent oxidoreductase [Sphingorhabdus sp.]|uniref:FAD-dependent oxidoreductase n=1 Tax=Sphingorhabdus sp. TaxID=1902408 RepID=UPI0037C9038D
MTNIIETDVLVVGAGPSGSITSLLLSDQGIRNIMINKYGSTSPGPRSHITNQRAMEILRDLDLEDAANELATPQAMMGNVFAESVVGQEFGRLYAWSTHPTAKAAHDLASPCSVCDLPQLYFEPLVVSQCSLRGSDVRFHTEYVSHVQDADGVTVKVRDNLTGSEYKIRAKYLVGADGARSKVAEDIGLPYEGQMAVGDSGSLNIEFTADLSEFVSHRPSDMFWLLQSGIGVNGTGVGVLRMVRPWNKWVCVWGYELAGGPPQLNKEEAAAVVKKLIGDETIRVTVDAMSNWTINQQYATRISSGRVFCMGDAIHRHTPMGGLGLNTSVQDAYNLAWKLALVIRGAAGSALLDTYDVERAPVAQQIVQQAYKSLEKLPPMFAALGLPPVPSQTDLQNALTSLKSADAKGAVMRTNLRAAIDDTLVGFGGGHGVEMNQRYSSSAVAADGTPDAGFSVDPIFYYEASSRPGSHLPHAWLIAGKKKVSTLDLCGKGRFTILTGITGGALWAAAAEKASTALGVEIVVHVIGPGQAYEDSWGEYRKVSEIDESGALLVRPDMFVAWRSLDGKNAEADKLTSVLRAILGV